MFGRAKLLFFVTEDWYFFSHRLQLAIAANKAGFEVIVITRVRKHGELIRNAGLRVIPLQISRRSMNPLIEIIQIYRLWKIYRRERPDIVHHVAIKPVLYGSLAAYLSGCRNVVNALAGMGFLFVSNKLKARLLRPLITKAFRLLINGKRSRLILQNPDDVDFFSANKLIDVSKIALIRGSGVNLQSFSPSKEKDGVPVVMLASRLLWDKGIGEFVDAASYFKRFNLNARFVLVGETDPENPSGISKQQLDSWVHSGLIEWWGHKENMSEVLNQAHIVCLPSYREGLPKVLLEATACGRPIITTDAPGCREIVKDGINGFLVPVKDVIAVAEAVKKLIKFPKLRIEMGAKGRELVEREFSVEKVNGEILQVYEDLLN